YLLTQITPPHRSTIFPYTTLFRSRRRKVVLCMNLESIKQHKIISIVRGYNTEDTLKIVERLYWAGIKLVEVTLNSPNALYSIKKLNEKYKDEMFIGAGTVLTSEECQKAIDVGAKFIILPDT